MSAFTVFSSDCILLNNLIDGLGVGERGRTQPDVLVDGQSPLTPQGGPGRWVGGGERSDRRQDQSYIQVRPTFHQSKTIHSIFMQKFEVECAVVQKPRLAVQGHTHRPGGWPSPEPGGRRRCASSPGGPSLLCSLTSVNPGISFP